MFTETTEYDYEILLKRLREESFLNAGVRITLTDERPESIEKNDGVPPQESMCYEGGVRSFVQYLHEKRDLTPLHPQVIYMKGEANGAVAEVALQYCDSYNELILSFANNVHTPEGGTHEEGLKTALTRVFNEFGRAKGYLKEKDENWQGSDVREGMIAVVSVKLQEAQFEGQTKAKLGNTYIKTLVSNIVYNKLSEHKVIKSVKSHIFYNKSTNISNFKITQFSIKRYSTAYCFCNQIYFKIVLSELFLTS